MILESLLATSTASMTIYVLALARNIIAVVCEVMFSFYCFFLGPSDAQDLTTLEVLETLSESTMEPKGNGILFGLTFSLLWNNQKFGRIFEEIPYDITVC